jgi:FMN-dependent oxidoreductase (nitrilotriacetate monooxygenase family)
MAPPWTIGMFSPSGLSGSWEMEGNSSPDLLGLDRWIKMARRCEDAGADFLFLADTYGYPLINDRIPPKAVETGMFLPSVDCMTIMSALVAATQHLGLVATVSTSVEKPQMVARKFATLDHLTGGRVGWNIVTGAAQNGTARLFGEDLVPHDLRYAMADDHVDLSLKLWEGCWEDDAVVIDRKAGVYADPDKVHEIVHDGPYYSASGLLSVPASPQRTPTLFQAGASSKGRNLAAKYAEGVFIAAEPHVMAEQIADIRARAVALGRSPDAIKFLVAGTFRVAPTKAEAIERRDQQIDLVTLEQAAVSYAFFTGLDLLSMNLDEPLQMTKTETGRTNVERFTGRDDAPAPTVRQILEEFRRNSVMGAPFIGDPRQVVDQAVAIIEQTGADGFLVQPDWSGTWDSFFDLVMPELARRGLLKAPSTGRTLRERLFGQGRRHLPGDHPGSQYRARSRVPA